MDSPTDLQLDPPIDRRIRSLSLDLPDTVQLFCVDLSAPPSAARLLPLLSAQERERAASFTRPHLAPHYVLTRAALRTILGNSLGCSPTDVTLITGEHGRPSLHTPQRVADFNLSHSANCALVAVCLTSGCIGVDVEHATKVRNVERLAQNVLTKSERAGMPHGHSAQDSSAARAWFYTHWTLKEAYLKALGTGLQIDPKKIAIDLTNDGEPRFIAHPGPAPTLTRSFSPLPGYQAALTLLPHLS